MGTLPTHVVLCNAPIPGILAAGYLLTFFGGAFYLACSVCLIQIINCSRWPASTHAVCVFTTLHLHTHMSHTCRWS